MSKTYEMLDQNKLFSICMELNERQLTERERERKGKMIKRKRTLRQLDRSDFSDSRGDSKLFNHEDATNIQMRGEGNHEKKGERNEGDK